MPLFKLFFQKLSENNALQFQQKQVKILIFKNSLAFFVGDCSGF